jgi:PAS domain S-box-containing protein
MPSEIDDIPAGPRGVQIARGASLFVIAIGLAVFAGWMFDFHPLTVVLPSLVSMKPNTAIGLSFAGLSLLLFISRRGRRGRQLAVALAGAVAVIGLLTLGEYASGGDLRIDELCFRDFASSRAPGRMAPITAFNFICLGLALILVHFPSRTRWAQALTGVAAFTSLLAIIGYFYGAVALYQSGEFTAVALHTAVSFLALCIGICCATGRHGFMRVVAGAGTSGMMARRYGVAAVVLPFVFGWLRLQGEHYGWFGVEFGVAMVAMANVVTFAALVWIGASSLQTAEARDDLAQESLRQAHLELELRVLQRTSELAEANAGLQQQMRKRARVEYANQQILDHSLDVICTMDGEGRFLQVSRACEAVWGYWPEDLIGRLFLELVHPDDREKTIAVDATIMGGEAENGFENRYLRRDGTAVPMVWTANWSEEHRTNFCVARDVTARKRMESELRLAKEAAEAATKTKGEFLANMSHEIRTPMNGIIGVTELVLESALDREQRDYLGMVRSSGMALLGLINDILDFSKIEAGKLALEAITFDLREAVEEMFKPLVLRGQQKGIELRTEIADEVPGQLIGDPLRLRQILLNFADNALKFTTRGSVLVKVAVEAEGDGELRLHFSVADTGIGIAPEKQGMIFEAFAQADGSTTRTYGGTGLGLAIASQLVAQMRGRIWIESTLGEGTTFHFTAWLGAAAGPSSSSSLPTGLRTADDHGQKALHILLAEDNVINRALATAVLEKRGHSLVHAANGREAVEAAAREQFDLIFMDVQMPEMDGFEATRRIREAEQANGRRTPIAAMTAHAMDGDRERCLAGGMDDYLSKPLQKTVLLALLSRISAGTKAPPAAALAGGSAWSSIP